MLRAVFHKHKLIFKTPGGTSRGVLKTKDSWFIKIFEENNPEVFGLGEASIIRKLSIDDRPDFEEKLQWCTQNINKYHDWHEEKLEEFPAIKFALETAFIDLKTGGKRVLFDTDFTKGKAGITINGLIWMGKPSLMQKHIADKMENGFRCIKLKIGAIDFEEELKLLKQIRKDFPEDKLELRVDANGAFLPGEALEKLKQLSEFGIHSIEQPIRQKQWKEMAELCKVTPIPIALDEELIGLKPDEIQKMLDEIMPQYIVLKPSLLGGFAASEKFIAQAEKRNIGWWVTSALEANVGLNAIAQWTSTLNNPIPQGLGTGGLFTNNTDSPLFIENDRLFFDKQDKYKLNGISFSEASLIKHALTKLANTKTKNWEKQIFQCILEWFNKEEEITVNTSGSTGKPKQIKLLKKHMTASANATLNFLNLKKGDKALLCLPAEFIAGKMMIVRSLIGGLDLHYIKPSLNPKLLTGEKFNFTAFVPSMVSELINLGRENELEDFEKILLGGSALPQKHEIKLRNLNIEILHTYGMTETITHIALRKINGKDKSQFFTPLLGVELSLSRDDTLVINYPEIGISNLNTTDIAELLPNNSFKILGRKDNVIISGGMKIHPEELEKKIEGIFENEYFLFGMPYEKLGQKVVLFIEGETDLTNIKILEKINELLDKTQVPKEIIKIKKFEKTQNGKLIRKFYLY